MTTFLNSPIGGRHRGMPLGVSIASQKEMHGKIWTEVFHLRKSGCFSMAYVMFVTATSIMSFIVSKFKFFAHTICCSARAPTDLSRPVPSGFCGLIHRTIRSRRHAQPTPFPALQKNLRASPISCYSHFFFPGDLTWALAEKQRDMRWWMQQPHVISLTSSSCFALWHRFVGKCQDLPMTIHIPVSFCTLHSILPFLHLRSALIALHDGQQGTICSAEFKYCAETVLIELLFRLECLQQPFELFMHPADFDGSDELVIGAWSICVV